MTITPALRRAVHQAADLILDALSEPAVVPKRRRGPVVPELPKPPRDLTPDERAKLSAQLKKAGYVAPLSDFTPEEIATAERYWARAGYKKAT